MAVLCCSGPLLPTPLNKHTVTRPCVLQVVLLADMAYYAVTTMSGTQVHMYVCIHTYVYVCMCVCVCVCVYLALLYACFILVCLFLFLLRSCVCDHTHVVSDAGGGAVWPAARSVLHPRHPPCCSFSIVITVTVSHSRSSFFVVVGEVLCCVMVRYGHICLLFFPRLMFC